MDYVDVVEMIQQQIKAELATAAELRRQNDLAQQTLTELARNRAAEQQRRNLAFDTNDKVSGLIPALQKAFRDIKDIRAKLREAERRAERTDDILLLLLTEKSPEKIAAAREDLQAEIDERETDRHKLLRVHTRNLARLREQAAGHGLRVPLDLMNEIESEEAAIRELQDGRKK